MSEISSLLNSLYHNDKATSFEKTAEDNLLSALRGEEQIGENPYGSMSDEDLIALLQDANDTEKVAAAGGMGLLEKTAAEMLGGQVMAHAMVHEMGLIKVAMSEGLCRVCKEYPLDIQGSSMCSGCTETTEA